MENPAKYLLSIGADNYFNKMNLSVNELFQNVKTDADPYSDHNWELRENGGFTVVNAIPDEDMQDRLFWEEWYIYRNEVHHHILTRWQPSSYDEIFDCPEHDDIHPALSFGKRWYVIDDPDMKPILLRGRMF